MPRPAPARQVHPAIRSRLAQVSLSIGIVGLPNVGKSTLFNALTRANALASNYPFATIEPNVGIVGIPDPRLGVLAALYDSARTVPATARFVDIAGLVRGASQGQGLGNQFLAHIRETDAICQVVRVFTDPDVSHVDGDVSPGRDIDTVATELILADLQTLEKAVPRLVKEAKFARNPERQRAADAAAAAQQLLDGGTTLFAGAAGAGIDLADLRDLHLLTAKPFLYVFNMDEAGLADEELQGKLAAQVAPAQVIFLDVKTEAELAELPEDEVAEMAAGLGMGEPGLNRLAHAGFSALGLMTFLTAGPKEVRAWEIPIGATAPEAAGVIHTDFQRGFIKAEVVAFDDLVAAGLARRGPRGRQGAHGGQGLRDARRRRGGVPLQRLTIVKAHHGCLRRSGGVARLVCPAKSAGGAVGDAAGPAVAGQAPLVSMRAPRPSRTRCRPKV